MQEKEASKSIRTKEGRRARVLYDKLFGNEQFLSVICDHFQLAEERSLNKDSSSFIQRNDLLNAEVS